MVARITRLQYSEAYMRDVYQPRPLAGGNKTRRVHSSFPTYDAT